MLIRASTDQTTVLSGATLGIVPARGPAMTIGVLPEKTLDGAFSAPRKLFSIALSSFRSAWLLIAYVSGAQTTADVFRGRDGAPGFGVYSNPRSPNFAQWRVDLTQADALSNLIVVTGSVAIVQLVIDDGKTLHSYMVPPGA